MVRLDDFLRLHGSVQCGQSIAPFTLKFLQNCFLSHGSQFFDLVDTLTHDNVSEEIKDFYKSVLLGETIIVHDNCVHVKAKNVAIADGVESFKDEVAEYIVNKNLIRKAHEFFAFKIGVIPGSFTIRNVSCVKTSSNEGVFEFDVFFSTTAKYEITFEKEWNASLYDFPRNICEYPKAKFFWDLLNYGSRLSISSCGDKKFIGLTGDPWKLKFQVLGKNAISQVRSSFVSEASLLAEFFAGPKFCGAAEELRRCDVGGSLRLRHKESLFSKSALTMNPKDLDCEIKYFRCLYEGLVASQKAMENLRKVKSQIDGDMYMSIGLVIAKKVCEDPVLYVDDPREYIAEFARKVVNGYIGITELEMYFELVK